MKTTIITWFIITNVLPTDDYLKTYIALDRKTKMEYTVFTEQNFIVGDSIPFKKIISDKNIQNETK